MKKNLLLLFLSLFVSTAVFAQMGGVQGKVVSRAGREAVGGTEVTAMPGEMHATTDNEGRFVLDGLEAGEYELSFEALDFEPLTIFVRVDDAMRDINLVILAPEMPQSVIDDASFADFDADFESSGSDGASAPTSLSASRDVFSNVASYRFSEMRFNTRGYDSQYQDIYLNGMRFNDALTGFGPWSLWTGLNDATRNQNTTTGLTMSDFGLGGVAGTTNINARASQLRQGLNASLVTSNQMYRFRAMATYASGLLDNGWSYAFSVSTRQGRPDYVDGIYYNTFAYFGSVEKIFNPRHRLGFTIMGSPSQRGAQQASTQEAYDLVGSNYYNPNVGIQRGKIRNTRVRNYHEPIAMLTYTFDIDDRTQLNLNTALRFGKNGYSALTWNNAADPRPDYYHSLPNDRSIGDDTNDDMTEAGSADRWIHNVGGVRYFDFDRMYQDNRDNLRDKDRQDYGIDGPRALYMIEERHTDQLDWNFAGQLSHVFENNMRLTGGLALRANRTEYYTEAKDLLGADYWADVDKFAERDFHQNPINYQNDLDYYQAHGHARVVREGDKYGYYYKAHVRTGNLWGAYNARFGGLTVNVGAEVGGAMLWREGMWRKGLFPNDSKGKSKQLNYLTYKVKGNFSYAFNANHSLQANLVYLADAPKFQSAFVSPRTRNDVTPGLDTEKVFGADLTYTMRYGDLQLRASGYYTKMTDGSKVISFYDDSRGNFVNFAMSGIDKRYYGVEFAAQVPIYMGISAVGAVSWGEYTYDSNPYFNQTADNEARPLGSDIVYWKGMHIESTPQLAATVGLSYRSQRNLFASVNFNYYDNVYLSMNPLYRTDGVTRPGMDENDKRALYSQEKFDGAFTLSASIGKNWYIMRKYTLGVSLEVKNILNDQNIKTGGYEQMRLRAVGGSSAEPDKYEKFDSKYFYMIGTNYYLNIYFRF